jgi:ribosomal protein S18 acetylase RimI-like enzyme
MAIQVKRIDLAGETYEEAIIQLLDFLALTPEDGEPLPDNVRETLVPRLREHPGTHVFLAFDASAAVGLAICFDGFSSFRAARLLNIHDLVVHPDCRGQGIGTLLLKEIESFARRNEYCKLTLEVRADGPRAHKLYVDFGFDPGDPITSSQSFLTKGLLAGP